MTTQETTLATFNPVYGWALIAVLVASFVALTFSLQAGIFILLFTTIGWYTWRYPEEGFLLFLILMPILPMFKITQTIGTFSLIKDVIIFTLFARLFVVPLSTKTLQYRRNILFAPLITLAVWSAVSALRADSYILGMLRLRDIGLYMMLYFAVLYLPKHTSEAMRRRLLWFTIGVVITLGLAAWQWFFSVDSAVLRFDPVREIWIPRISSILAHPSIYGEYLIAAFTLFVSIVVYGQRNKQWWFILLTVLTLPAIFLTYSRAVWIGTAAAVAAMAFVYMLRIFRGRLVNTVNKVNTRRKSLMIIVSVIVCIAVGTLLLRFTPAGGLVRSIFDPTYQSNEERVEFFVRLIAPLSNTEAVVGRGLGDVIAQNFREVDLEAYDIAAGASRAVQLTKNTTLVDNQYLKTFIEMGVVGIVLYLWLYWRVAVTAIQSVKSSSDSLLGVVGLWAVGFVAAFAIQALFIDIWDIFPTNALFWINAALLTSTKK
ncbi:MAG: O-antigen ligase family protein [Candidatus Andersenbacteria bacterium]|nr:O-antigen ligase family protein [Candidatus Andersenbacteria bacterium]MBI3250295.1 O-antigen ligase family protein [Candidatus Andersenbacteria bacterium]